MLKPLIEEVNSNTIKTRWLKARKDIEGIESFNTAPRRKNLNSFEISSSKNLRDGQVC